MNWSRIFLGVVASMVSVSANAIAVKADADGKWHTSDMLTVDPGKPITVSAWIKGESDVWLHAWCYGPDGKYIGDCVGGGRRVHPDSKGTWSPTGMRNVQLPARTATCRIIFEHAQSADLEVKDVSVRNELVIPTRGQLGATVDRKTIRLGEWVAVKASSPDPSGHVRHAFQSTYGRDIHLFPLEQGDSPDVVRIQPRYPGDFRLVTRFEDALGPIAVVTNEVRVLPNNPPQIRARIDMRDDGTFHIDASASSDEDGIVAYRWQFPGGSGNGTKLTAAFGDMTAMAVTLVATDAIGLAARKDFRLRRPVVAEAVAATVEGGLSIAVDGEGRPVFTGKIPMLKVRLGHLERVDVRLTNGFRERAELVLGSAEAADGPGYDEVHQLRTTLEGGESKRISLPLRTWLNQVHDLELRVVANGRSAQIRVPLEPQERLPIFGTQEQFDRNPPGKDAAVRDMAVLAELPCQLFRVPDVLRWAIQRPTDAGRFDYDFSSADFCLQAIRTVGRTPLHPFMGYVPSDLMPLDVDYFPSKSARWRACVRAAVDRYRGQVNCWEPFNEPPWKGMANYDAHGAEILLDMQKTLAEEVRARDPGARIAGPGFCHPQDLKVLEKMVAQGAERYLDWWNYHEYDANMTGWSGRPGAVKSVLYRSQLSSAYDKIVENGGVMRFLGRMREVGATKPLVVSECGGNKESEDEARGRVKAIQFLRSAVIWLSAGVQAIEQYELYDYPHERLPSQFALVEHGSGWRHPMFFALRELTRTFTAVVPDGQIRTEGTVRTAAFRRGTETVLAVWNCGATPVPIQLPGVPAGEVTVKTFDPDGMSFPDVCSMEAKNLGRQVLGPWQFRMYVYDAPQAEASLVGGFMHPPKTCRPQVWWWFDTGAGEAAITRDLEALARVGVSGFHIYGGSATDAKWLANAKWALHEAHRLGLDGVVCIGAAGCGHAQTDPLHAQKDLVFTQRMAKGGTTIRLQLPKASVKETPKHADGSPRYFRDIAVLAVPQTPDFVPCSAVRDVTRFFDTKTEELVWENAPTGTWRILRAGFVPKVFGWMGCYIDHMSRAAFDAHWARVMDPLLAALAADERSALKGVMCDSWEAGTVSWTETFPAEFRARRGYDILPWLPAKAGVKLENAPKLNRFMRDFNETVGDLIAENHYAYQKEVANRHGLVSIAEAAGPHQQHGDVRRMQGRCDVAMGEFWMPSGHRPAPEQRFMLRDAAHAAHVYGIPEVLAEAFTTINTYWIESPETMKPCADRAFCDGLTRVCYHGMKLSPSLTDRPGAIRNVGTHYNPQTTWFEQSRAFNDYLARCSWMLSRGRFAADCLIYAGDAVGLFAGMKAPRDGLGEGYDYDYCPTELLLQAKVDNGEIVLPSGMRYRMIVLSDRNPKTRWNLNPGQHAIKTFPPVSLAVGEDVMVKLRELVEGGAMLVGPRPSGPTSMNESSARYHAAADVLWGPRGGTQPAFRNVGRGRVFRDRAVARAECGLAPDVEMVGNQAVVDWIHRTAPEGEIYFLANREDRTQTVTVRFRAGGAGGELWNPVTGERTKACGDGREVTLELPRYGSTFVVFPRTPTVGKGALPGLRDAEVVTGPWTVQFDPAWGGPTQAVNWTELRDWSTCAEPGICFYSGTAVYRANFDLPGGAAGAVLDLGRVAQVAEVRVNGRDLGVVWTDPFAVPLDGVAREKGNSLEIRVTNLWPNRLIGDAAQSAERRFTKTNINPYKAGDPLLPSGLLGPVRIRVPVDRQLR